MNAPLFEPLASQHVRVRVGVVVKVDPPGEGARGQGPVLDVVAGAGVVDRVPPAYVVPLTGCVMAAAGTEFCVTKSCAASLVAEPKEFDTTTSKSAPLSESCGLATVWLEPVAPAITLPLRRHW